MNSYRTSARILASTLLVYALLVSTHLGEFWPFSIYPMFSKAGQPWTRVVVRTLSAEEARELSWEPTAMDRLPGDAFPLVPHGISQNDVANYVSKTTTWTSERIEGFLSLFRRHRADERLLVVRVQGRLAAGRDAVEVVATPYLFMHADSIQLNPAVAAETAAFRVPSRAH